MKKKDQPEDNKKKLGPWGKLAAFIILIVAIYGAVHFYNTDSKPKVMTEYDIRNNFSSAVKSIYGNVADIQSTCANPNNTGGGMVGLSARDVLLMDANSAASDLHDITALSEQFEKFDPNLNAELASSFKRSEALVQSVLATKKCPKDPAAFDFLKGFSEQTTKVFPCQGIC